MSVSRDKIVQCKLVGSINNSMHSRQEQYKFLIAKALHLLSVPREREMNADIKLLGSSIARARR